MYQYVAPTLCDSTAEGGICWSVYFVRSMTESPGIYFDCAPDNGYSVDNLEPEAPRGLQAEAGLGVVELTWDPNQEEDFDYYAIYRGIEESFAPDVPIGYTTTEYFADDSLPLPDTYYYKVTATDFAGNESDPSLPAGIFTDVPDAGAAAPASFFLGPAIPNPFNPFTKISYGIPVGAEPAPVIFSIYDPAGRKVKMLL